MTTVVLPKFHITTFGCQMNAGDSDWLRSTLLRRGFQEGSFKEAGLYILNTCSVRDKPEQKVYSELGRIRRLLHVQKRSDALVCVGGCVAQQVGAGLFKRFTEVRLVFGPGGTPSAPDSIERLLEDPTLRISHLEFSEQYEERPLRPEGVTPAAVVSIMQGCDNFCAYCIVPYVRGRQKSRHTQAILAECRVLLEHGAKEITLLGQNVNSFGQDNKESGESFSDLLYKVAELPGLERLRFVTPHPKDIAPEVIEAFAQLPVLCPRLHLPLQSGADRILKAMGRKYNRSTYLDIVERLKKARPDMLISTDIIVGFPGETEKDFLATLQIMQEMDCAFSYSFIYSDRPGARAALLPDKIDKETALERLGRLQSWQSANTERVVKSMIGGKATVLVEDCRMPPPATQKTEVILHGQEEHGIGVSVALPDGLADPGAWVGKMLPVRIKAAGRQSLKAEIEGLIPMPSG